jgi:hypothetical protein
MALPKWVGLFPDLKRGKTSGPTVCSHDGVSQMSKDSPHCYGVYLKDLQCLTRTSAEQDTMQNKLQNRGKSFRTKL